jgi:malate dehydrogenase (quinone)
MSPVVSSDDREDGAAAHFPWTAGEADVTSESGGVAAGGVPDSANPDVVLVGGGIMSATLAALINVVAPQWSVTVFESGDEVAGESSGPWNNAGTGHAALCELNYTPAGPDGRVDPSKAVTINEQFQVSRQFWSYLVRGGMTGSPKEFITPVPHLSFVTGEEGRRYMRARHEALSAQPLFQGLEYTEDPAELGRWIPLMMAGRDPSQVVAATRSVAGTDVNFGSLTRLLLEDADSRGVVVHTNQRVQDLDRGSDGRWTVTVRDTRTGERRTVRTRFVFVGAGGGALPLLQKAGIPEIRGFGGFPVSGMFLHTRSPELVSAHQAKVYGHADPGAPSVSVPHLDHRTVDGREYLMFGPFAAFSPRFLRTGRRSDLVRSVRAGNLPVLAASARDNRSLMAYLVRQVAQTSRGRTAALRTFLPAARSEDWELVTAGQRVQVLKMSGGPGRRRGAMVGFGTEIVTSADGSLAALLGASPGASTAAATMVDVLAASFPGRLPGWVPRLREIAPSAATGGRPDLDDLTARTHEARRVLGLDQDGAPGKDTA